ncbi:MAG: amino acid ABC transporter permease [Pseudomonadota bacterium]
MSDQHASAFVRDTAAQVLPAPASEKGLLHWFRANLFATPADAIMTIVAIIFLAWIIPPILNWLFFNAVWTGENREACLGEEIGACWAFVNAKFAQFIYGRYPIDERWRVDIVFLLFFGGLLPLAIPGLPYKRINAIFMLAVVPVLSFVLLTGGLFGLEAVETPLWGGFMLTLVVAVTGIAVSLPLGVLLALGRRSELPVIRLLSIVFIEVWRGVPLVTVLFMASVMLPLFLPQGVTFDKLLRALIGVALFASAYMAEVIRGGLQAIPKGQYEGADALGLSYWKKMNLIILPQALKLVIPGIVNTFIGLFKDTSLVYIIGLFDLLGTVRNNFADADWSTPTTPATGLIFAGFVFWIFCFGMSRYSMFMERRLDTGRKR